MKTVKESRKQSPTKMFKFDAAIQEDKTMFKAEDATARPADTITLPKPQVSQSLLLDKIERDLEKGPV